MGERKKSTAAMAVSIIFMGRSFVESSRLKDQSPKLKGALKGTESVVDACFLLEHCF
jgi:hypothetical protein